MYTFFLKRPLRSLQSTEELVEEGHIHCVVGEHVTIASRYSAIFALALLDQFVDAICLVCHIPVLPGYPCRYSSDVRMAGLHGVLGRLDGRCPTLGSALSSSIRLRLAVLPLF
jgi:hypothetical protein